MESAIRNIGRSLRESSSSLNGPLVKLNQVTFEGISYEMPTWMTNLVIAAILLVLNTGAAFGAPLGNSREVRDFEWKMMSIVSGTYNWDTTSGSRRN